MIGSSHSDARSAAKGTRRGKAERLCGLPARSSGGCRYGHPDRSGSQRYMPRRPRGRALQFVERTVSRRPRRRRGDSDGTRIHLAIGQASGCSGDRTALRAVAGGAPGDLSLFRTLEALAIGVQGKRCLWRAAQALGSLRHPPGRRSFVELEADAVRQWETIERHRRSLVPRTFGA